MRRSLTLVGLALLTAFPAVATAQAPSDAKAKAKAKTETPIALAVTGYVPKPLKLDAEGFAGLPRQTVRVKDRDGEEVEYEGAPLCEALKAAGLSFGEDLRGLALADYLVVEAADGYKVVFAIPELDPAATDRVILLADRRDGKPLGAKEGPLRVIVPGEKRHFRWARQVVTLRIGRS